MRGGGEYKHGFGVSGYGGANFSGELSNVGAPSSARGDASTSSARADGAPAVLTEAVMGPSPKGHRVSLSTQKPSYDVTEVIDQPPPTARRLPQPDPSAAWPWRISRVMSPVIRPSFELDVTHVKSADPELARRFHAFTPSWRPKSA